MNKFLDSNGVLYLWSKIKAYIAAHTVDSMAWDQVTGKPDLALKSDLASVYRYKGSAANYAALPAEGSVTGDVWNVEATGMNYAWNGEAWDALGEAFEIDSITNAEIDAIMDGE